MPAEPWLMGAELRQRCRHGGRVVRGEPLDVAQRRLEEGHYATQRRRQGGRDLVAALHIGTRSASISDTIAFVPSTVDDRKSTKAVFVSSGVGVPSVSDYCSASLSVSRADCQSVRAVHTPST